MKNLKNKFIDNWVITGGCGFIGKNLIAQLLIRGSKNLWILDKAASISINEIKELVKSLGIDNVTVELCNKIYENNHHNNISVKLIDIDIFNRKSVEKFMPNDCNLVHLAANSGVQLSITSPKLDFESNVQGLFNCLDIFRKKSKQKFIFASSSAVLGEIDSIINEDLPTNPISPYGVSKLYGEKLGASFAKVYSTNFIALRFANVYGKHSEKKTSVVAKFIKNAIKDNRIFVNGDGTQTRDFIYVDDLINSIILTTSKNVSNDIFQISSNKQLSIFDLSILIKQLAKELLGKNIVISYGPKLIGDIKTIQCENSKALKHLEWQPRIKFEDGIRHTFEWFIRNNKWQLD